MYFAAAKVGLAYAVVGGAVSLIWPSSGIALVALLLGGARLAGGIALGSLMANLSIGVPPPVALCIAAGATLEGLAGFYLLHQDESGFSPALDRRRDVVRLIVFAAALSTVVNALIGGFSLVAGGIIPPQDYPAACVKWWLGDMMGVLVFAPPLLAWLTHPLPFKSPALSGEAMGLAGALGGVGFLIFGANELAGHGYFPAALAIFPFVIWAALRFDHWGASLATLAISLIAIWGTTQGTGPFASESAVDSLVRWSAFVNVLAVSGLLLAASHSEELTAQAALKHSLDELDQRVKDRTFELASSNADLLKEIKQRRQLEEKLVRVSDEQQKAIGRELHDGLGQYLTSIRLHGASLHQKLQAQFSPEADNLGRMLVLVNQAAELTRALARGLYPVALESAGLRAALLGLADTTRSLHQIPCTLDAPGEVRVRDPGVAINLYRIAQEAITNAVKYSQATHIRISLTCEGGFQTLAIHDNGVGIALDQISQGNGLGMHSLRHRAGLLGGACRVERNPLGGTTVIVRYPTEAG